MQIPDCWQGKLIKRAWESYHSGLNKGWGNDKDKFRAGLREYIESVEEMVKEGGEKELVWLLGHTGTVSRDEYGWNVESKREGVMKNGARYYSVGTSGRTLREAIREQVRDEEESKV